MQKVLKDHIILSETDDLYWNACANIDNFFNETHFTSVASIKGTQEYQERLHKWIASANTLKELLKSFIKGTYTFKGDRSRNNNKAFINCTNSFYQEATALFFFNELVVNELYNRDNTGIKKFINTIKENPEDPSVVNVILDFKKKLTAPMQFDIREDHDKWLKYKIQQGWKYGPNLDKKNKLSPDIVEFEKIPEYKVLSYTLVHNTVELLRRVYFKEKV